jgi:hypothetical protein
MAKSNNPAAAGVEALAKTAGIALVEDDGAPTVLYGDDLNEMARRLGEIAARLDIFRQNGDIVFFRHDGTRERMTGRIFRTWINQHVVIGRRFDKEDGTLKPSTLKVEDASTVLECDEFLRGVRQIEAVNHVRLPVIRPDGSLELLPWGYDGQTKAYTIEGGIDYDEHMDIAAARGWIKRVYGGFPFQDERSISVQVASLLALYIKHLPGGQGLRPGFLWLANKPQSGKSLLAKSALYPVLGSAAAAKMKKREDLDKELEAFARAAVPYIFLDNVYGGIESASIDQMLTSEESTGRAMGGHGLFTAKNTALLVVTGNNLELNADAERRFLIVDLFEKGDPNDRKMEEEDILDDPTMRSEEWRATMLAVCCAFVRHWDAMQRPKATILKGSFEHFSRVLGGIVEAAGYEPPCQPAIIPDAINPDKADFAQLMAAVVEEMEDAKSKDFSIQELCRIARAIGVFEPQVGTMEEGRQLVMKIDKIEAEHRGAVVDRGEMHKSQSTSFGARLKKEVGQHLKIRGITVEFGKREQSRKSTWSIRILD